MGFIWERVTISYIFGADNTLVSREEQGGHHHRGIIRDRSCDGEMFCSAGLVGGDGGT